MLAPDLLAVWQTGVLYHLIHALGLFVVALLGARFGSALLSTAGLVMFAGIVLFSGSLYLLAVTGTRWLGAVTPLGGVAFLLAWALVRSEEHTSELQSLMRISYAVFCLKKKKSNKK